MHASACRITITNLSDIALATSDHGRASGLAVQSAPWCPIIIATGLVAAAFIVANSNKPAPVAEPTPVSPSERL
jgi:hypothetical protein